MVLLRPAVILSLLPFLLALEHPEKAAPVSYSTWLFSMVGVSGMSCDGAILKQAIICSLQCNGTSLKYKQKNTSCKTQRFAVGGMLVMVYL